MGLGLGECLVGGDRGKLGGLTAAVRSSPSVVWHAMKLESVCRNFGYNVRGLNCNSGHINMPGRCV